MLPPPPKRTRAVPVAAEVENGESDTSSTSRAPHSSRDRRNVRLHDFSNEKCSLLSLSHVSFYLNTFFGAHKTHFFKSLPFFSHFLRLFIRAELSSRDFTLCTDILFLLVSVTIATDGDARYGKRFNVVFAICSSTNRLCARSHLLAIQPARASYFLFPVRS